LVGAPLGGNSTYKPLTYGGSEMKRILGATSKCGMVVFFMLTMMATGLAVDTPGAIAKKEIKIGAVPDLSGRSSEYGNMFARGVRAYFKHINKTGGINGQAIKLLETDGAYSIPKETAGFKRFAMEGMVAFIAWSTGGHMQIVKMGEKEKIVIFGAGLSEKVFENAPWAFMHAASYDQVWRGLIGYEISKNPGKKPKAAILYPDSGWGHQNRDTCRAYLKKRGLEIVAEEIMGMRDVDATTQMLNIKKAHPDFVLSSSNEGPICIALRDATKVGIDLKKIQFYVPQQGFGPLALKLCSKEVVEDYIGAAPYSSWHEKDLPAIKLLRQVFGANEPVPPWTIHGWTCALVLSEGLKRVGDKEITGENLKAALEGIRNFNTGGITPPITFTPEDHVGAKGVKLFKADVKKGFFKPITGWITPE